MGIAMSIRARLTIAIVVLATVAVLSTVVVKTTGTTLIGQVDEQVLAFADRAKGKPDPDKKFEDQNGSSDPYFVSDPLPEAGDGYDDWERNDFARLLYSPDGEVTDVDLYGYADDRKAPPDCPDMPSPELDEVLGEVVTLPSTDGTLSYRTLIQQVEGGNFLAVGAPLTDVDDAVSNLLRAMLIASAVALLVATALCWWVIRQGLKPVDYMVATAAAIAGGDLGARIDRPDPVTELGWLGSALNDMMGKIQVADDARTAGEVRLRRFVADAAHELRTPLTSLRG